MNAEERFEWDEEDRLFQEEFLEISHFHNENKSKPPSVPSKLSKLIRKQAALVKEDDLSKNWLFSPAMLMVLVVLILFSVGLLFTLGASTNTQETNAAEKPKGQVLNLRL
jgi:hypothetical protein